MFSMHLNDTFMVWIFLIPPGFSTFINLQRSCPSLRTSQKLSWDPFVSTDSPVTALIHSKHSLAASSLYLELILAWASAANPDLSARFMMMIIYVPRAAVITTTTQLRGQVTSLVLQYTVV